MKQRIKWLAAITSAIMVGSGSMVSADTMPYQGYSYNSWGDAISSPNVFLPEKEYYTSDMGLETSLNNPSDLYVDRSTGDVYVADTDNHRIVILDRNLHYKGEVNGYTEDGTLRPFKNPQSLALARDGVLYVADTENQQIIKMHPDGQLLHKYEKPTTTLYPQDIEFKPNKVEVDEIGNVYALIPSLYQGIAFFDPSGEFGSFYGSNHVDVTVELLMDYVWKKIMAEEQAAKRKRYVPINYLSMALGEDGYMYTTLSSDSTKQQIRKLNALGNNILRVETEGKAVYGERDVLYLNGQRMDSLLVDICVDEKGIFYALDSTRGRIFMYDQESNSLGVFGGSGKQTGTFQRARALDYYDGEILVLDATRNTITRFSPTAYGELIIQAVALYSDGLYDEAMKPWKEVLKRNQNLELAYDGIGKALLAQQKYQESLYYFEKANDTYWYSKAFAEYRIEVMHRWILPLTGGGAVLILILIIGKKYWRRVKRRVRNEKN